MRNHDQGNYELLNYIMDRIRVGCDKFGIYQSLLWYRFSLNNDLSLEVFIFGLVKKEKLSELYSSAKCECPGLSIGPNKKEDLDKVWAGQAEKLKYLRDFLAQDPRIMSVQIKCVLVDEFPQI